MPLDPGAGLAVYDWHYDSDMTSGGRAAAREWFAQHWAVAPDEVGTHGVAAAQRGDGVGDGEFAISGGFQTLPETLAEGLDVRLATPVATLDWTPGRVVAEADGHRLAARAAVVAVPPAVVAADRLRISGLDVTKQLALAHLRAGDACCAVVTL